MFKKSSRWMQRMVCMSLWMNLRLVDMEKTLIAIMFLVSVDVDKYNGINKITIFFRHKLFPFYS